MRKLSTANITTTAQMPVKSGTLVHLQLAYQEALTALANSIIGRLPDNTHLYILYGCVNTGTYPVFTISAGAIYYNGEVYLVDATTFTCVGDATAVANIVVTQYETNADPVNFTNGTAYNVHDIRKIAFAAGASGSGIADYDSALQTPLVLVSKTESDLGAAFTVKFDQDKSVFFSSASSNCTIDFDMTNAVPGAVVRLKWTFGAGKTLSISGGSGITVVRDSGNLGDVASANNLLYFLYCGINEVGEHEISYTLKQF